MPVHCIDKEKPKTEINFEHGSHVARIRLFKNSPNDSLAMREKLFSETVGGKIDISRCTVYGLFLMVNQFTSNHNYHLKAACKNSVVIRKVYFSRPMIFNFG